MTTRIAILGDFNPAFTTLHALNDSLRQCIGQLRREIQCDWIATDTFSTGVAFNGLYSGLLIAPGSPYRDMENVLKVIRYAREYNIPTLGNCGGFQHMLIEFARNVCGITHAGHEEVNSQDDDLVISKLSCSLVEQQEELSITDKASVLYTIIKQDTFTGKYFCSYGLNPKYRDQLAAAGCAFTAFSADGQVRAFELKSHSFFLGTLFQPALTSTTSSPHPILVEFLNQCILRKT